MREEASVVLGGSRGGPFIGARGCVRRGRMRWWRGEVSRAAATGRRPRRHWCSVQAVVDDTKSANADRDEVGEVLVRESDVSAAGEHRVDAVAGGASRSEEGRG